MLLNHLIRSQQERLGDSQALILIGAVWASESALEGPWDMYPTWWPVGVVATALLLLVLLGWALLHLVPLILVFVASVLGIRWLMGATGALRSDSAVAILRERYARGEIGKEGLSPTDG